MSGEFSAQDREHMVRALELERENRVLREELRTAP